MLQILFVMLLFRETPIEIFVKKHDPVIPLEVFTPQGQKLSLNDLVENEICFFVSTQCQYCLQAIENISVSEIDQYFLIFLDDGDQVSSFVKGKEYEAVSFYVKPASLKPYNIARLPAVLAYKDNKLKLAYHGPLTNERLDMLIFHYNKP